MIKTSRIRIKTYKKKSSPTSRAQYCVFEMENLTDKTIYLNRNNYDDYVGVNHMAKIINGHWKEYL